MTVIDILFRLDDICKKYDKYDIEKQRDLNAHGDDAFARFYATVESEIDKALLVRKLSFFFPFNFYFCLNINDKMSDKMNFYVDYFVLIDSQF